MMGHKGCKYKEVVPFSYVIDKINTMPAEQLMPAAKVVCGADYAVRYYNNRRHVKYYHNNDAFRYALRRCFSFGAFDHRRIIIRMLDLEYAYHFENLSDEEDQETIVE